ncbi:Holliday junction branch migration protein RuvA [Marinobacterium jannaschii]|uniref:Holliday junction branch migration protein RuvA n=1 Tax=Marinobacterium jannaschii TaxID=64970 RepID=UPI00048A15F7|nr:Holliday junction branch migration protein RuvA [Marinobacterium jannaschii]
MIGRLKGELVEKQPPQLLLDVNGVGYELEASMNTFYKLPEMGKITVLYTHFVVREDAQLLYAFADKEERLLFRTLIKVNGVGPKLALTILSGINSQEFVRCVHDQDTAALVRLPGVGKKTAERLIVEMKDKLASLQMADVGEFRLDGGGSEAVADMAPAVDHRAEAESALVALGYKPVQATKAIAAAEKVLGAGTGCEDLIRQSLKSMVSG